MSEKVIQKGNTTGGSIIGVQHNTIVPLPSLLRQIEDRLEGLNVELEKKEFRDRIFQFDYYYSFLPDGRIRSLDEKLTQAGRAAFLKDARREKELFSKMLETHIFSETAQNIYAIILGRVVSLFNVEIFPLLSSGIADADAYTQIYQKIVKEITSQLPPMCITITDPVIFGMIHYLTGKCLLEWG